jgi:competence protein ComEC
MMPLFWIAISFVFGLLCGRWLPLPLWIWLTLSLLLLAVAVFGSMRWKTIWIFRKETHLLFFPPVVLVLFLSLGASRYALQQPHLTQNDLAWYNDKGSYTLTVVVSESPDRREDATYLHVTARELYDPDSMIFRRVEGKALVRLPAGSDWQLGDMLRFTASPRTPKEYEDFSYRDYLARYDIYTVVYFPTSVEHVGSGEADFFTRAMDALRQRASATIFASFPQPESGLLAGILLGNDNDLPGSLSAAYQSTGTAHIIAISGFNMSMLAAICTAMLSRLMGKKSTLLVTSLVLAIYTVFVGGAPSVVRAAIMAIFAFGGQLIGRKHAGINVLGLTAGLMVLFNPLLPWDASFQLSFTATLGLLLFADPMKEWLRGSLEKRFSEAASARLTGPIAEYFLYSLAAQVMTLPVIALQFHRLSLTALVANPLVLPVQPVILVLGMAAILVGLVWPLGGKVLAMPVWALLAWSNRVAEWIGKWRWGSITLSTSSAIWIAVIVSLIVLLFVTRKYFMKWLKNINWIYVVLVLLAVAGVVFSLVLRQPDGKTHLSLIRAGEGTALFVRSASGATLLIDPLGSANELAAAIGEEISPWNVHVDAALLTNRAATKGLEEINNRLLIEKALLAPPVYRLDNDQSPVSLPAGMTSAQVEEHGSVNVDESLTITVFAEDGEHTAILITFGNTRILVPGGVKPSLLVARQAELTDLSVLILNEQDVANLPADMWANFGAQTTLWNSTGVSPCADWVGLDQFSLVEIVSEDTGFSIIDKD